MKRTHGIIALGTVINVFVFHGMGAAIDNTVTPPQVTGRVICNEDYTVCEFIWDPPGEVSEYRGDVIWDPTLELVDENEPVEYLNGFVENEAPSIDVDNRMITGIDAFAPDPPFGESVDLFQIRFNCIDGCPVGGEATFSQGADGFVRGRDLNDVEYELAEFSKLLAINKCDYNQDGVLDVTDLNLLRDAVMQGDQRAKFDINEDGEVDSQDIQAYVNDPDKLNTFIGDANLDGEFTSDDLVVVFVAGEYEDGIALNSVWETGDWNGNGEFESGDLVFASSNGGYEAGPKNALAVPEPSSMVIGLFAFCGLFALGRRSA